MTGVSAKHHEEITGRTVTRDVSAEEQITWEDLDD